MDEEKRRFALQARILWVALLLGPVMYFVIVLFLLESGRFTPPLGDSPGLFLALAWGLTFAGAVAAVTVRSVVFRPRLRGEPIPPQKWLAGHVVAWAFCEGAAMLGISFIFVTGDLAPYVYPGAVAFALQVLQFPRGP